MKESIVIADLHGHLDELNLLLAKINFNPAKHNLYFVGDFIDRGKYPIETVRFVKNLCDRGYAKAIMGNHEEFQIEFHNHHLRSLSDPNYENPLIARFLDYGTELYPLFSKPELDWMASLPLYHRINDYDRKWLMVHAGFMPFVPLESQDPYALLHIRYVNEDGSQIVKSSEKRVKKSWTEFWQGPESVVYGHTSQWDVRIDEPEPGVFCCGIDTGVDLRGGMLSALVLPSMEVVQVKTLNDDHLDRNTHHVSYVKPRIS